MSDVVAGPPPTRVWAVRFQDGGGWRLIGNPETMRVLRARGDIREEQEYVSRVGVLAQLADDAEARDCVTIAMSAPLAQHLGYGAPKLPMTEAERVRVLDEAEAQLSDEREDPDVAAALARTRYAGALPLGLAKERQRRAAALDGDGVRVQVAMERALDGPPNGPTPGPVAADEVPLATQSDPVMLTRQRDDATARVARLAVDVREADAAIEAWRERETALQDDLERGEAALGRAMSLLRYAFQWHPDVQSAILTCLGLDPADSAVGWPDVTRWVSDAQGGERDDDEQGGAAQEQAPPTAQGPGLPGRQDEPRGLAYCVNCGATSPVSHRFGCTGTSAYPL